MEAKHEFYKFLDLHSYIQNIKLIKNYFTASFFIFLSWLLYWKRNKLAMGADGNIILYLNFVCKVFLYVDHFLSVFFLILALYIIKQLLIDVIEIPQLSDIQKKLLNINPLHIKESNKKFEISENSEKFKIKKKGNLNQIQNIEKLKK